MNRLTKIIIILLSSIATINALSHDHGKQSDNEKAVKEAILDYVEGIYLVDESRIERSVSKDLAKVGYSKRDEATEYTSRRMTYEQLYNLSKTWNKEGRIDAKTAIKEIQIFEVTDQTASVKLSAAWGMDYMHLAKVKGKWMIVNVIWQTYPK